jgi:hypothetical protein
MNGAGTGIHINISFVTSMVYSDTGIQWMS